MIKYVKRLWFTLLAPFLIPIATAYVVYITWKGECDSKHWNPFK